MTNKIIIGIILITLFSGCVGSIAGIKIYRKYFEKPINSTKNYYDTENKVSVSPATLRKMIDDKDNTFILVDLRSREEYAVEHIIGAVNIPAVTLNESEIVNSFKKLPQNKQIIVHCYSAYCMLGKQVGQVLAKNGIYVKDLNVGWSEWKYYWGLWNPGEDPKTGLRYLEKGTGSSDKIVPRVCVNGQFGC